MVNGKTLYVYNKDTGLREELKIEASSVTFANSPTYELFQGSTDKKDGFGGGFFPKPLKTDRGSYIDLNGETQKVPFFLASDGTWKPVVTDGSVFVRKDENAPNADHAVLADTATNAVTANMALTAEKLSGKLNLTISLDSTVTAASFDGSEGSVIVGVTNILPENKGGTGSNSLANVTVGNATNAQNDGDGLPISGTYLKKPVKGVFTVNKTQWIQDTSETGSEFVLYYDIAAVGMTDSWIPTVTLNRESQAVAVEAGFFGAAESLTNKIRLRCKERPTATISGSYYAFDA